MPSSGKKTFRQNKSYRQGSKRAALHLTVKASMKATLGIHGRDLINFLYPLILGDSFFQVVLGI